MVRGGRAKAKPALAGVALIAESAPPLIRATFASQMSNAATELEQGRLAYARSNWSDAHGLLTTAAERARLDPPDLELLATAAYMLGKDDEHARELEHAHHGYLDAGAEQQAAHCACWIGISLALRGEMGRASGWFGRAQRILDVREEACVEHGYLLIPSTMQKVSDGDFDAAYSAAARAVEIGRRFADGDLVAIAIHVQGRARLSQGRLGEGLPLLDEAMVSVVSGELSPIATGIVYCSVIEACQEVFELGRAREWTEALSHWCEGQQDLVSFTGKCLMHRAEIMQLHGEWSDALEEARRARKRLSENAADHAVALAVYREAEILRLRGEVASAGAAYEEAARIGCEPQPGLALLRLAQGKADAAAASMRRALGEATDPGRRARLLPVCVEIMLAVGDVEQARTAAAELKALAEDSDSAALAAMAAYAGGALALADGDAWAALSALRHSEQLWRELRAPYEAARCRMLVAVACRAVGDRDTAAMELDSARSALNELGALSDLAHADELAGHVDPPDTHGLTARELDVLGLIARGNTNKGIAAELVISERTVDRHVSNILAKLRVRSRSAATAYAYEHGLL